MANQRLTNEEIAELIRRFDIAYGRALAPFTDWLLKELKDPRGRTIRQIVNEGWELFSVSSAVTGVTIGVAVDSAVIRFRSALGDIPILDAGS